MENSDGDGKLVKIYTPFFDCETVSRRRRKIVREVSVLEEEGRSGFCETRPGTLPLGMPSLVPAPERATNPSMERGKEQRVGKWSDRSCSGARQGRSKERGWRGGRLEPVMWMVVTLLAFTLRETFAGEVHVGEAWAILIGEASAGEDGGAVC